MTERCIVRVKFTPVDAGVRSAVGGFLRYIQHRDLQPTSEPTATRRQVSGLVKYAAYRDGASSRAELFASDGGSGSKGRKDFVEYVACSISASQPQLFRTRDGRLLDRRRAVSRLVISPERASGLDLERLTQAAMERLSAEVGGDVRWIAAIHRNTGHHHVHLVVAGMRRDADGRFHRLDITKLRLTAIKQAVGLEIERQRTPRLVERPERPRPDAALAQPIVDHGATPARPVTPTFVPAQRTRVRFASAPRSQQVGALLQLRAVARIYQRRLERDAEQEARRRGWELAA